MDLGLRQSDVAIRIGVGTQTVNYWENGHFNPEPQYVPKIVAFLGSDPFRDAPAVFPLQLKAARIKNGLSRRHLAARFRVHPYTVAKWERGEAEPSAANRNQLEELIRKSGCPSRNPASPRNDFLKHAGVDESSGVTLLPFLTAAQRLPEVDVTAKPITRFASQGRDPPD